MFRTLFSLPVFGGSLKCPVPILSVTVHNISLFIIWIEKEVREVVRNGERKYGIRGGRLEGMWVREGRGSVSRLVSLM